MDCKTVIRMLQEEIDGRLPPSEAAEVRRHVDSCATCAAEADAFRKVGEMLRLLAASRAAEKAPQLDALWTRVSAGIEERKRRKGPAAWVSRWLWIPATAAVAVIALLFYPSNVSRAPYHPTSFDVAVEDLESDAATVAFVDKGDDLPRVIWIIENDKT
jgi:anti-sigma factor RsiW